MNLLTTSKINLEELFQSDQLVPYKYFSKGKVKTKTIPISTIDKSYIYDCSLIIDAILQHQKLLHDNTRFINLSSVKINTIIGNKRRLTALFILEHSLGIIDVNHNYAFKGKVNTHTKSYTIAPQYRGDYIYFSIEGGSTSSFNDTEGGLHLLSHHSKANNNHQGGTTSTYNILDKKEEEEHPIIVPLFRKVNKTTGRVFNHVNLMKKEDRKNLKDEHGNLLVEVDFSSSNLQHIIKLIREDLKHGTYVPMHPSEFIKEVCELKEQILNSDLYQTLATEHGNGIDRNTMKQYVMYWLTGCYQNRKVVKWINYKYPLITHYITHNNTTFSKGTKIITKKNFTKRVVKKNGMAIRLMQSESHLVNDLIMTNVPTDVICHTVFDGFMVEKGYLQNLSYIISEQGKHYLEFEPKVKVTKAPEKEPELDITMMSKTVLDNYFVLG